jgi:alkylation response protein AidB-like acyl-CoA dehydrogenase
MTHTVDDLGAEIAASAHGMLSVEWPVAALRRSPTDRQAVRRLWDQVDALGWLDVLVPVEAGGLGQEPAAAGLLAEKLGWHMVPGPLLESIVGRSLLAELGLIDGHGGLLTLAVAEPGSGGLHASGCAAAGGLASGVKAFVPFGDEVDVAIVTVRGGSRPGIAVVHGLSAAAHPRPTFDLAGRPCWVDLGGTTVDSVHDDAHGLIAGRLCSLMTVLVAARLCGVADRMLAATIEHARVRHQFGAPIATFQAVRHRIAGMRMRVTTARNAWLAGATALARDHIDEAGRHQAATAARTAKAYCSRAAREVAEDAMQVHGGIAFTAEHDLQLAVRHTLALQASWGDERHHESVLGAQLVDEIRKGHRA